MMDSHSESVIDPGSGDPPATLCTLHRSRQHAGMATADLGPIQRAPRMLVDVTRRTGRVSMDVVQAVGQISILLVQVLRSFVRQPQRRKTISTQLYRIGFLSLPVVVVTGVSVGLVLAIQSYATLSRVSGETMTGAMVNFALVAELAPVLTGLMLAGRVGSSIAAEIGTMKVTEQLDAMRVMGTDPIGYLVAPRFAACLLLLPVLAAIGAAAGIVAAQYLALGIWDIDPGAYWAKHRAYVDSWDILTGLCKAMIFGGTIALVACRRGLRTEGGASGVGTACTEGVVSASLLILVGDFVLTVVFQHLFNLVAGA